jgi:hypothetical protein
MIRLLFLLLTSASLVFGNGLQAIQCYDSTALLNANAHDSVIIETVLPKRHLGYQAESRWSGCNLNENDQTSDGPKYGGAWWLGEECIVHRGLANILAVLDWVDNWIVPKFAFPGDSDGAFFSSFSKDVVIQM